MTFFQLISANPQTTRWHRLIFLFAVVRMS